MPPQMRSLYLLHCTHAVACNILYTYYMTQHVRVQLDNGYVDNAQQLLFQFLKHNDPNV